VDMPNLRRVFYPLLSSLGNDQNLIVTQYLSPIGLYEHKRR